MLKNSEVKRLLFINAICIVVFIFVSIISSNMLYNSYKKEQIKINSYVVGNLIEKHPELEGDIISGLLMQTNYEEGKKVLEKYGLTNLDSLVFDKEVKLNLLKTNLSITIFGLLFLFLINVLFVRSSYKKINKIDKYMTNILNGNYSLDIKDYCEGDISNLKNDTYKMTVLLKEQSEALQKEKVYLEELLEDISHQIKTPLTSMYMIQEILTNEKDEKIRKEFLEKNQFQLERIEWLIKSLLKMSRLDSGTIKLKSEKVTVQELINNALEPIKVDLEIKNIDLQLTIPNITVKVDNNWTSEALLNIIKNASEHTKDKIIITAQDNPIFTSITIEDNGNGISKKDLPHIFERFYKGSHNKDSIGIGLNMSKKIINLQNGIIEVKTKEKVGTSFVIRLFKKVL